MMGIDEELGACRAEIPVFTRMGIAMLAMLVQSIAMLVAIVVAILGTLGVFGGPGFAGVLLGVALLAMVVRLVFGRRRGRLRVCERGIELLDGADVCRYRYEDVLALSHDVLLTSDGREQRLTAADKQTLEPLERELLASARERLARGETVRTDAFVIGRDNLEHGKQAVPWADVRVEGNDTLLMFSRPGIVAVAARDVPASTLVREQLAVHGVAIVPRSEW